MGVDSNAELRFGAVVQRRTVRRLDTEGVPERSQEIMRDYKRNNAADGGFYFDALDDHLRGNRSNWKMPWYSIDYRSIRRERDYEEKDLERFEK